MFAKVVIDSPLPQLEREFEYTVPTHLEPVINIGVRVKVAVGTAKKLQDGFVISLEQAPSFDGKLSEIQEVVSAAAVLPEHMQRLLQALATRQAAPLGELLKLAIPNRSVAVEKAFLEKSIHAGKTKAVGKNPTKEAWLLEPIQTSSIPSWVGQLVERVRNDLNHGSVIVCLPDQADIDHFLKEFGSKAINYSSSQTPAKRYAAFLDCLISANRVVVGNRASLLAPVADLGSIFVLNESDFSHTDQGSPYLHSRDIALVRQQLSNCNLTFAGYSISTDIFRLVAIKYLTLHQASGPRPKLSYEEDSARAETLAQKVLRQGLASGPVLVQVSALGHSVALYCKSCQTKLHCNQCAGPLWMNQKAQPACRWCNALNFKTACRHCGGSEFRQGRAGASRSVAELGKVFPGIRVIESSSSNRIQTIEDKPALIVATPGCEPVAENGYAAVVLLDAKNQLSRESLRSVEDAVGSWSNAVSLLAKNGQGVLVGVGGKLAEQFVLWQQVEIANDQFAERAELGLPPAVRLGSITGGPDAADSVAQVAKLHDAEVLGPTVLEDGSQQYVFKYAYSVGAELASHLKAAMLKAGAGINAKTKRMTRLVRVKMDDRQVI